MEFLPDWRVDELGDFDMAVVMLATSGDEVAVELQAQLRPNGRVLDQYWARDIAMLITIVIRANCIPFSV